MIGYKTNSEKSPVLTLTVDNILAAMGYSDFQPEKYIIEKTEDLLNQSKHHSNPSFNYKIYEGYLEKNSLQIANVRFDIGKIISNSLKGAVQFAVFTATAGTFFQKWTEEPALNTDIVNRYIVDCIGTEIVEATADYMQRHLAVECRNKNYAITNRYSPGYCGWNIQEQHKLFTLLDEETTSGIRLTDSALMLPVKSVSGIIGIGKHLKQKEYGCSQCNYPKCFRCNNRTEMFKGKIK